MERFASAFGIVVFLGLAWALSTRRRAVPWRLVGTGIALQAYLAVFIVRADAVPWLLPIAAGLCGVVLVRELVAPRGGFAVATAQFLGLLGVLTCGLLFWVRQYPTLRAAAPGWRVPVVAAAVGSLFLLPRIWRGRVATSGALAGCAGVIAALLWFGLPNDFVYRGVAAVGAGVTWLIGFAAQGADSVFGGLRGAGGFVFAIEVGSIILLFGGLMSALYHIGLLPWLVGLLARFLHRALGVSGAESLAAASNVFLGQTEAPLVVRPYLARMTQSELMALMVGGFATIAGSVLGAYIKFLQDAGFEGGAAHLISASVMSAPAAFVLAKIMVPETEEAQTRAGSDNVPPPLGTNLLDAFAGGVTAALKLAVNVVGMLLVFYALIKILNTGVEWFAHEICGAGEKVTFQDLYARLFQPFAWLIGVEAGDTRAVGELLGTKTIFNEFIAYDRLGELTAKNQLADRSVMLSTYALCGFANFMSIGIQIAGLSQLAPSRRADFARLALRAMIAGALACQLTACVVGLLS